MFSEGRYLRIIWDTTVLHGIIQLSLLMRKKDITLLPAAHFCAETSFMHHAIAVNNIDVGYTYFAYQYPRLSKYRDVFVFKLI